jgi:radical SAM superfamily enzyme YgiQ (UPF0313 family)
MRILLINPIIPHRNLLIDYADEESLKAINTRQMDGPPLGLNDLAGILSDEEVRILDLRAIYDRNPHCSIEEEIYKELKVFDPDIVGITCITAQLNSTRKILKVVKEYNNQILNIVGGIHPTSCPLDFKDHDVDLIVIGPGKRTLRRIVDEFKRMNKKKKASDFSTIPGLAQNKNGELLFTKQFYQLTRSELINEYYCNEIFPNRELTEKYDYRVSSENKKIHYINTSMGCTGRCNFCFLWKFYNGYYAYRKVDSIIKEIETMDKYPVIRFCDAHTFGDIKTAHELFNKIIEKGIKHEYVADVRADSVMQYPYAIKTSAKAGLKVVIIGLEATTDEELEKYGKGSTVATTEMAMDILNDAGIWISGNYIVNCDNDEKDFENIARFVENHPIFFSGFTIITPFPGTEQYEMLKDKIVIKDLDYYNLTNAVLKTKLPEEKFYKNVNELYKVGLRAREKFLSKYTNPMN